MASAITHISHPNHWLEKIQDQRPFTCNMCSSSSVGIRYHCSSCNFNIHEHCTSFPEVLMGTFAHPQHSLSLRPAMEASRYCDVCGLQVNGMSYHCAPCDFDVHPGCSTLPKTAPSAHHPDHILTLQPPGSGVCLACCQDVQQFWSYQCIPCRALLHVKCLNAPRSKFGPCPVTIGQSGLPKEDAKVVERGIGVGPQGGKPTAGVGAGAVGGFTAHGDGVSLGIPGVGTACVRVVGAPGGHGLPGGAGLGMAEARMWMPGGPGAYGGAGLGTPAFPGVHRDLGIPGAGLGMGTHGGPGVYGGGTGMFGVGGPGMVGIPGVMPLGTQGLPGGPGIFGLQSELPRAGAEGAFGAAAIAGGVTGVAMEAGKVAAKAEETQNGKEAGGKSSSVKRFFAAAANFAVEVAEQVLGKEIADLIPDECRIADLIPDNSDE